MILKAEHPGDLVKGFTGRVVERRRDAFELARAGRAVQVGVAAGDDQGDRGKQVEVRGLHRGGPDVGFDVVDGDQRELVAQGDRFGRREPDQQRADEAWSSCDGDGVEVGGCHPGFGEGALDDAMGFAHVRATGDLGDDAAKDRVHGGLAVNDR